MKESNIENFIEKDIHFLLKKSSKKNEISINKIIEIGSFTAAKYLRIIFAKNKEIKQEELKGVIGLVSNTLNTIFGKDILIEDYQNLAKYVLDLLNDTEFDKNCEDYFK